MKGSSGDQDSVTAGLTGQPLPASASIDAGLSLLDRQPGFADDDSSTPVMWDGRPACVACAASRSASARAPESGFELRATVPSDEVRALRALLGEIRTETWALATATPVIPFIRVTNERSDGASRHAGPSHGRECQHPSRVPQGHAWPAPTGRLFGDIPRRTLARATAHAGLNCLRLIQYRPALASSQPPLLAAEWSLQPPCTRCEAGRCVARPSSARRSSRRGARTPAPRRGRRAGAGRPAR